LIWSLTGGEQRSSTGLADVDVDDDTDQIRSSVIELVTVGCPALERSDQYERYLERLSLYDARVQATREIVRQIYAAGIRP
jgi:malonate decarboxylase beta subunit